MSRIVWDAERGWYDGPEAITVTYAVRGQLSWRIANLPGISSKAEAARVIAESWNVSTADVVVL